MLGDRVHQPHHVRVVIAENAELEALVDVFFA
jgi:hypothetical protein